MSTRNHKAIFERKLPFNDWEGSEETWEEVTREWISLNPLSGRELIESQQVQALTTHKVQVTHSPTMATVTTADRMKVRKTTVVNEDKPDADENFRIFHIENIVNVREANRVFELMVQERV